MLRKPPRAVLAALLVVTGLSVVACQKKVKEEPAQPTATMKPETAKPPVEDVKPTWAETKPPEAEKVPPKSLSAQAAEFNAAGVLRTVYFEFDKSDLTEDGRRTLAANAAWLRENASFHVLIEGHCDERDTEEYNLALGDRRASSVRGYLGSLGIDASRMRTVSFGEERPADPGHAEAAWAKNRRAAFVVEAP